jgi:hypothetical protein
MHLILVLQILNLFVAGVLAGIEIAIHYGFARSAEGLDERSQIELRKALVLRLRVLVPAFFLPTAVSAVAVTILDRGAPGFWWRCAGLVGVLLWVLIRVVGTVAINSATLTWQPEAPPSDWKARINHVERFHIVGVWAVIGAFATFLTAIALQLNPH